MRIERARQRALAAARRSRPSSSGRSCRPSGRSSGFTSSTTDRRRRRDGNRLGREPRQAAAGHHPQHASARCSTRSTRPASSTSSAPASNARRPAPRSTSPIAAWIEVYTGARKDSTVWQPRPTDPQLEAELLSRLMVKLGAQGRSRPRPRSPSRAGAPARAGARPRARTASRRATLQVDDGFDRAWRRVGLALDRSGFTVEDRDRAPGPLLRALRRPGAGRQGRARTSSPSCSASARRTTTGPARYRVAVKGEGDAAAPSSVLDSPGRARERRGRQAHRRRCCSTT